MKSPSTLQVTLLLGLLLSVFSFTGTAAEGSDEQQQINVLQSSASPQQKDAACARLKRIGTARSVPALAALLADEQLSHSARYALESMPAPEASRALVEALGKTTGLTRIGLINSVGLRGETEAVPALAKLLAEPEAASAAAQSLGKIGGPEALQALEGALPNSSGPSHGPVADALLACANRLLAAGERTNALAVFQRLYQPQEKEQIRLAAYRGMIRSAGDKALALSLTAIEGTGGPSQAAALQLVRELDDPAATKAFAALLPKSSTAVRIALIEGLSQRGDAAAAPAIAPLAASTDPAVRLAAINALGVLGDASAVAALAQAAAGTGAEQKAARYALAQLRRGNVTEALLAQLTTATGATQVELVRALGARAEAATVPKLLELARNGSDSARSASFQALGMLADASHLTPLAALVLEAKSDTARTEAKDALDAVCQRIQSLRGNLDVEPIVKGLSSGSPEARVALLQVCSGLVDSRVREAVRAFLKEAAPAARPAAIRALCETRDPALLPDLLAVARENGEASLRVLALRGYVRLATQEEGVKLPTPQRLEALKAVFVVASHPQEQRLVLSGLANVSDPEALKLVMPLLDNPQVQAEAAHAATRIAASLAGAHAATARAALKQIVTASTDPAIRGPAEAALKQMDAAADFIITWQVAGPYRQEGKNYEALFDIVFAPETPETKKANWRPLPSGTDPKQPWLLDLLKFMGGEQCVAYVWTQVYSETEQPARLELGCDDGEKVWLNGKMVLANNVARPLVVGSDKVNVTLQQGWNKLMLKITQNGMGWEFCARFVKPNGTRLDGLRFDASKFE
jgi:HEAT repeat protein